MDLGVGRSALILGAAGSFGAEEIDVFKEGFRKLSESER